MLFRSRLVWIAVAPIRMKAIQTNLVPGKRLVKTRTSIFTSSIRERGGAYSVALMQTRIGTRFAHRDIVLYARLVDESVSSAMRDSDVVGWMEKAANDSQNDFVKAALQLLSKTALGWVMNHDQGSSALGAEGDAATRTMWAFLPRQAHLMLRTLGSQS